MSDIDYSTVGDDFTGSDDTIDDDIDETDADDVFDDDDPEDTDDPEATDDDAEALPDTPATKAEMQKLRNEAKNLRERAKTYEEAFGGLEDPQREAFLAAAELYKQDPVAWARELAPVVQSLLGETEPEGEAAADEEGLPFKTVADMEKYLEQRDAKRDAERVKVERERGIQESIRKEADEVGYDMKSPDWSMLKSLAVDHHGGDLKAAHEALEARITEKAQALVKAKREASKGPKVVRGTEGVEKASKLKFGTPEWKAWADSLG